MLYFASDLFLQKQFLTVVLLSSVTLVLTANNTTVFSYSVQVRMCVRPFIVLRFQCASVQILLSFKSFRNTSRKCDNITLPLRSEIQNQNRHLMLLFCSATLVTTRKQWFWYSKCTQVSTHICEPLLFSFILHDKKGTFVLPRWCSLTIS